MAHPSFAPSAHDYDSDDDLATRVTVRPRGRGHLSVVPPPDSSVASFEPVAETFRKLGSMSPAACENDELTEDELFAIWVAHLC